MNKLDKWEWAYAFSRSTLDMKHARAVKAANWLTGESREVESDQDILARLKSLLGPLHDAVCCENCDAEAKSEQPSITRN